MSYVERTFCGEIMAWANPYEEDGQLRYAGAGPDWFVWKQPDINPQQGGHKIAAPPWDIWTLHRGQRCAEIHAIEVKLVKDAGNFYLGNIRPHQEEALGRVDRLGVNAQGWLLVQFRFGEGQIKVQAEAWALRIGHVAYLRSCRQTSASREFFQRNGVRIPRVEVHPWRASSSRFGWDLSPLGGQARPTTLPPLPVLVATPPPPKPEKPPKPPRQPKRKRKHENQEVLCFE